MYHKPSTLKRKVTHNVTFEQWRSSITRHQVSNASRVSADYYGNRNKCSKSAGSTQKQSSLLMKEGDRSDSPQVGTSTALLEKQQRSEREDLEDELRLERDEEDEKLRQVKYYYHGRQTTNRLILRQTDRQTDGRTDRRAGGRTNRQTVREAEAWFMNILVTVVEKQKPI